MKKIVFCCLSLTFISISLVVAQGLVEFSGPNKKVEQISSTEKEAFSQMQEVMKLLGDERDVDNNRLALKRLGELILRHREYSDAYTIRATTILHLGIVKDYGKVVEDIDNAIRYASSKKYRSMYESNAARLSIKAKAEKMMGLYAQAVQDFEKAVRESRDVPSEVISVSGTKAEDAKPTDLWTKADFDELIKIYPSDYRTYLFRGYFYSFFTTFDEKYYNSSETDYEKAIALNASSSLPYYLMAELSEKGSMWTKRVWSDLSGKVRDEYHTKVVGYANKAIDLDRQFKEAYIQRATALYSLQQYDKAIQDYNKIVEIDPAYAAAYNDRGLAYFNLGKYYNAIDNFNRAIELRSDKPEKSNMSYKNRADSYLKVGDYRNAIHDYGKTIELELGNCIILMNIVQFRNIYPEFGQMNNEALTRFLWQKFFPNLQYSDFAKIFLDESKEKQFSSTIVPEMYLTRGDAYLNDAQFVQAMKEYNRAMKGFPDYSSAIEKWRVFGTASRSKHYLNIENIDSAKKGIVEFWTKEAFDEPQDNKAYTINHCAIVCSSKQIKIDSSIDYDSDGNVVKRIDGGNWQRIVPDSFGEFLLKAWCGAAR